MLNKKLNQGKSVNIVRNEVGTFKEEEIQDKTKKVILFIMYINGKISRLKRKQSYRNGMIVKEFYNLNNFEKHYNNLVTIDDIMECKIIESDKSIDTSSVVEPDVNLLEYTYYNIVNNIYIDHAKQLEIMPPININKLLSGQNVDNINIKEAFRKLEVIYKTVTTLNKIDGYLKEKRKASNEN